MPLNGMLAAGSWGYSDISLNRSIIKYWPQKGIRQMKESVENGQKSNANWP